MLIIAKNAMRSIRHQTKTPEVLLGGFLAHYGELIRPGCGCLIISVQPFAYVVANYPCYGGDKKRHEVFTHKDFTSFLLEAWQQLYYTIITVFVSTYIDKRIKLHFPLIKPHKLSCFPILKSLYCNYCSNPYEPMTSS